MAIDLISGNSFTNHYQAYLSKSQKKKHKTVWLGDLIVLSLIFRPSPFFDRSSKKLHECACGTKHKVQAIAVLTRYSYCTLQYFLSLSYHAVILVSPKLDFEKNKNSKKTHATKIINHYFLKNSDLSNKAWLEHIKNLNSKWCFSGILSLF